MRENRALPADKTVEDEFAANGHLPEPPADGDGKQGDFRGRYGYGRPAYKPDPDAAYSFEPGPRRTLALDPKRRWR